MSISCQTLVAKKRNNKSNDLFFYLFNNFIGGADDEEMSMNYLNLDLNNNNSLRKFLQDEIIPFYEANFSLTQKEDLETLLEKLESGEIELGVNEFENQLFPFETPNNLHDFCKSIKNVLFEHKIGD